LAETHRPQIGRPTPQGSSSGRTGFYGLGWNVDYDDQGQVRLNHSGAFDLGAATVVSLVPSEELGVIVLTNASPIGVPEAISKSFFDLVFSGKVEKDWFSLYRQLFATELKPDYGIAINYSEPPNHPSPALRPEAYAGSYRNDLFGEIEVAEKDGGLVLLLGPKKNAFGLHHFDRDVFTYQPTGENAYGLSAVTFTVGADKKAARVVIENLDVDGQGSFTRVAADN